MSRSAFIMMTIPVCALSSALLLSGCKRAAEETPTAPEPAATAPAKPAAAAKPAAPAEIKPAPAEPKPAATTPAETKPAPAPEPAPSAASQLPRVIEANDTLKVFLAKDPGLQEFVDGAHGYAIFPSIVKGGLVVSGAAGDGVVFEQGTPIGYSKLSQGGIGATVGGQEYSELIFFETKTDLERFKDGNAKFSAQASAVAATAGASADAAYSEGVAIFTIAKGGLMLEASVGGQGFSYEPLR